MFHVPAHKQPAPVVPIIVLQPHDAKAAAQSDLIYRSAYALWSPFMQSRWKACRDQARLSYAKADVLAALKAQEGIRDSMYIGKCYAELDAIRDAELRLSKRRA